MFAVRFPAVLSLVLLAVPAFGQETELPTVRRPATLLLETDRGIFEEPLPALDRPAGPLVSLPLIVGRLGGELTATGPLGQGFELTLLDQTVVFGEGSTVLTLGQRVVALSQAPVILAENPYVPIDLLTRTYGEMLGFVFRWDRSEDRLEVARRPPREIGVSIDVVHLQGVTTVVLQFAQRPRYRVEEAPGRLEVQVLGDRLDAAPIRAPREDPLVRGVDVASDRVRLRLDSGAVADHYSLESPFRLVFDVHRDAGSASSPIETPLPGQQGWTIVIDPGHGGSETGAIGPRGTAEKDLTLILARSLKARLEARLPVRVVLTRDEDAELPLETRTALANQNQARLFMSLHLNASVGRTAHGAETYFLSLTASDEEAARIADLENREAGGGGGEELDEDLQLILWDLAQSYHMAESQRLANLIQRELNEALGMRDRGVRQAPFKVLMGATMPAVLVELGFLTHPEEEARLHDPAHRNELVEALVRAVSRFRSEGVATAGDTLR